MRHRGPGRPDADTEERVEAFATACPEGRLPHCRTASARRSGNRRIAIVVTGAPPPTPSLIGIIPRWEWRTFGTRFGPAEAAFAAMSPTGIQESDEVYLLSGAGDNVKVRADLMDVKVLREVNEAGLEQWIPMMKASFPLAAADVTRTFDALSLPVPQLARDEYTFEQFVAELAQPAGIRAVNVHKRRVRYKVNGCTSEVTDVVADGHTMRTIAIESEDADAVVAAVASVHLGDYVNTSYPKGLAAALA